jgi:HD-GYP domain-containing protein (c-di-GMP phosphodiesterase class II)
MNKNRLADDEQRHAPESRSPSPAEQAGQAAAKPEKRKRSRPSTRALTNCDAPAMNAPATESGHALQRSAYRSLAQTQVTLQHRERQIDAMQRIANILFLNQSVDDLVRETLQVAIDVMDADVGSLQLYDAQNDTLVFRHVVDPNAAMLIGLSVPITQGIDGRVFRSGISDITNKVSDCTEWNQSVDNRTGYHTESMLTVPVKRPGGDPIGVIQVLNGRHPFDQYDLEALEVMCGQVAQAIANARLLEESTRCLDHIQALRNIDIAITSSLDLRVTLNIFVEQVVSQLELDAASVLLLNPHTQMLEYGAGRGFRSRALQHTHLRLGESLAGRAALERRVVHIPDLAKHESGGATLQQRAPLLSTEEFVSYHAVPLISKGQVKGVLETFYRGRQVLTVEWREFLETLAGQAAIAIDNAELFNNLQRSNTELALAYDTTLEGWSHALDMRDKETEGHTQRVTELTVRLARAFGMSDGELVHVRRGALLHDIGKMGIPDSILLKPGPLDDAEWALMRQHPVLAYNLLSPIPYLRPAIDVPYCHHEKWDGSGYPRGLKREQIPLCARIFTVIDVWDALRSDRPYRPAWPEQKVRDHIRTGSGTHFDPAVIVVFEQMQF